MLVQLAIIPLGIVLKLFGIVIFSKDLQFANILNIDNQ